MASKKSFITEMSKGSGAAASYITTSQEAVITAADRECKSKRLNLLIKPTTHADINKIAVMMRISVNELINKVLEGYAADHADLIQKYDKTFDE